MVLINLIDSSLEGVWTLCRHRDLGVLRRYTSGRCVLCHAASVATYRSVNPDQKRETDRKWRLENPERSRELNRKSLRKAKGVVWSDSQTEQTLWVEQRGLCAICGQDLAKLNSRHVHVDHNHAITGTANVRGLLCKNCNNGLGHFLDNPNLLRAAALYAERHDV